MMKKIVSIVSFAMCLLVLTACGSQNSGDGVTAAQSSEPAGSAQQSAGQSGEGSADMQPAQPDSQDGKTLVVYYSATGNTEDVANDIAEAMDADVFELEPAEPYSDADLDWRDEDSRVVYEYENPDARTVELTAATISDWESYDTIFIGYPIWWGIAAWPVDEFIAENDFTGKTVIPFCTSSSSGLGESGELLEEAAGTGNWLEGERFPSGASTEDVQAWVESLGL